MKKSNEIIIPSYFSILTADVRYNKDLSSSEKIFYSEISALTTSSGYCYANNNYFEELFNVDTRTITRWLNKLSKLGFIKIDHKNNKRYISLVIKRKKTKRQKNQLTNPSWLNDYVNTFENSVEDL